MPKEEIRAMVEKALRQIDSLEHRKSFLDTDDLTVDYGLDSLDHVELLMSIEDDLDITIDDAMISKVQTVGDLVELCKTLSE